VSRPQKAGGCAGITGNPACENCTSAPDCVAAGCNWTGHSCEVKDDLDVAITIITGEHSRDSSSTTTNLTLSNSTLLYEQSYHGARSGRRAPVKKQYKLTKADKTELIALLNEKDLWVTKKISKPPQEKGTSFYFELELRANSKGKQSLISIEGSRSDSDLQEDAAYRSVVSVIDVLYRVIRRKDADTARPELIR